MEEVRGTFNMLPQYNSENYSVQGMLNEIRAMNTFLFAINGRSARTYASSCGQTVVGGEDYSRICAPRGWCALCATMDRARTGRLCCPFTVDLFHVPSTGRWSIISPRISATSGLQRSAN